MIDPFSTQYDTSFTAMDTRIWGQQHNGVNFTTLQDDNDIDVLSNNDTEVIGYDADWLETLQMDLIESTQGYVFAPFCLVYFIFFCFSLFVLCFQIFYPFVLHFNFKHLGQCWV